MKKNKQVQMMLAIIGSIAILTIGTVIGIQIGKNHQVNKQIIDQCFESFDTERTVTIKKEGFWSPVSCEKHPGA
ncbi:hypothetical protein [Bacillus sp. OG2]|uniref:hypothetical protein n=1 Tax=Bacillus infantis TaxID=324767 RepID=UPI000B9A7C02|nr:hypothetical protein B9K06_08755 [Bacillus sp. OG2]